MATQIVTDIGSNFWDLPAATIYSRASWADLWVEVPYLQLLRLRTTTGDRIGQASFVYRFGEIKQPELSTFTQYDPLDKLRHFVKIVFSPQTGHGDPGPEDPVPDVEWFGLFLQDDQQREGTADPDDPHGDQVLHAVSLEWCLSRVVIDQSLIDHGPPDQFSIKRGLPFNGRRTELGQAGRGNRYEFVNAATGVYNFAGDSNDGELWSALQAVEYLIDTFQPFEAGGLTLELDASSNTFLSWYTPLNIETHHRTLYQVLNQIINAQVGLTWSFVIDDTADTATIKIHSFAQAALSLPSGGTLPANATQWILNYDEAVDIIRSIEVTDSAQRFEQVVCTGAYRTAVFTAAPADSTLDKMWTDAAQTDYKAAASGVAGYGSLDLPEQEKLNTTYRSSERMRQVYTTFRLPEMWDGQAGDGEGGTQFPVFPELDADGALADPAADETLWTDGLRFSPQLSLLLDHDYSSDPASPAREADYEGPPSRRAMFAVVYLKPDKWSYIDRLSDLGENESAELVVGGATGIIKLDGYSFGSSLSVLEGAPGLAVRPRGGPSHLQAGGDWWDAPSPAAYDRVPEIYWQDIAVTVMAACDTPAEARYPDEPNPATPELPQNDQVSRFYIRLGDRMRMDYLVQGTVLDVDSDGSLIKAGSSGWVRNDFDYAKDVAKTAWEWHQTSRVAFQLEYRQVSALFQPGEMIQAIGEVPNERDVNSVITSISWDFTKGTTQIQTAFTETLDFAELV